MPRRAHVLDTVRLLRPIGEWPAGTIGAVVSERADAALVEVDSEHVVDGEGLPSGELLEELIAVPYAALEVLEARPLPAQ